MADRVALLVSPHPDDELIGAGATLMMLRDAGWRVVNVACSLGRPAQRERRRAELEEACRRARFELVIAEALPELSAGDDLAAAQRSLTSLVRAERARHGAGLIVGPSPHDGHHGHEVVGRAIRDAVEADGVSARVFFWGVWSELALPTLLVRFEDDRLREVSDALAAHESELARNDFDRLLRSRAEANAVLGPERVLGFGGAGIGDGYAELLCDLWFDGAVWRLVAGREFDARDPLAGTGHVDVGWWLHADSVRRRLQAPAS